MALGHSPLIITTAEVADAHVLRFFGTLDATTYVRLRDAILKAALDEPRAVIVDVSRLTVASPSGWAVFTSTSWQMSDWPAGVALALVCDSIEGQKALRRNGISRYIPVYWSVDAAIDAVVDRDVHPHRRRASAELPAATSSSRRCRELIGQWLTAWSKSDYIMVVSLVTSELVDNALTHTDGKFSLRLETDGTTVTVAVHDTSAAQAIRLEPGGAVSGLELVAASCRAWGNTLSSSGKTVWAVMGPENRI
jgi:anti-anti-sigma factor